MAAFDEPDVGLIRATAYLLACEDLEKLGMTQTRHRNGVLIYIAPEITTEIFARLAACARCS